MGYLGFTESYSLRVGQDEDAGEISAFCGISFLSPEQQLGCRLQDRLQFDDMSDLRYQCGQSRLWAGLHFTASVDTSEMQCSELGSLANDLAKRVRNGSTWGSTCSEGQPRPTCKTPS